MSVSCLIFSSSVPTKALNETLPWSPLYQSVHFSYTNKKVAPNNLSAQTNQTTKATNKPQAIDA